MDILHHANVCGFIWLCNAALYFGRGSRWRGRHWVILPRLCMHACAGAWAKWAKRASSNHPHAKEACHADTTRSHRSNNQRLLSPSCFGMVQMASCECALNSHSRVSPLSRPLRLMFSNNDLSSIIMLTSQGHVRQRPAVHRLKRCDVSHSSYIAWSGCDQVAIALLVICKVIGLLVLPASSLSYISGSNFRSTTSNS